MGFADLHMHSRKSDGSLTPLQIENYHTSMNEHYLNRGKQKFRDIIGISDHDTIEGVLQAAEMVYKSGNMAAPIIIVNEEITSRQGHIVAVNIKKAVAPGMSVEDTITAIHEQGGLAVAAHPYTGWYQVFRQFKDMRGVQDLIYEHDFDAVEVLNGNVVLWQANMIAKNRLADTDRFALVGSSDAHYSNAFSAYTHFPGTTVADLYGAIKDKTTEACGKVHSPRVMFKGIKEHLNIKRKEPKETWPKMSWEREVPKLQLKLLQAIASIMI